MGPCLTQEHLVQPDPRPAAATAISVAAVVPRDLPGWALQGGMAAGREEVTVTPGCLELREEWAQKPGLMQASIGLQRAPAWLPSMPGQGSCSQCRPGTCRGCLPGHCPGGASSSSPMADSWNQHDVTGRNVFSKDGSLLALSRMRSRASGAYSCPLVPGHCRQTPRFQPPSRLAPTSGLMLL